ncbi:MAG: hypothetical protein VYC41_06620 [Planctomycetota bacterium]|nr:hypothetical protein [Phycisphaerales bacterium]MEC8354609.1 hypothetical protein [Planctomycetota bacterium]MEE2661245.1 hypothetical protein [Planctomycetota bacterium]
MKCSEAERRRRAGHRQWLPMVVGIAMLLAFVAPAADELLRGNAFAEEVLVVAEDLDPRLSERLRSLQDSDPEGFAERIAASTQLRALVDMRREDRRAYDLKILEFKTDAKVRTLAATVRQAREDGDDAAFASGREELRMQLRIQAGMRLANRLLQIERMEDMVEKLRERYDREVIEAEADVEVRLQNLLEMTNEPAE